MASLIITVASDKTQAVLQRELEASAKGPRLGIVALGRFLIALAGGLSRGTVTVQSAGDSPVAASVTATLATVVAANTITVGGVTMTASASPAGEAQFSSVGTNAEVAASMAAAISAHSVLGKLVSASAAGAVVTITARQAGVIGNQVPVSKVGAPITLSAAALVGGAGGAQDAGVVLVAI